LLPFSKKLFESDAGGFLLCLLLGGALGLGQSACASVTVGDADFDTEELLMVRATLGGEDVLRLACSCGLEILLEGGLVVADGSGEGVACREGTVQIRDGGLDDVPLDEGAGSVQAAIEVEGGDYGFECIGEKGWLLAASTLFFSAAEPEHGSEADALSYLAEVAAADERGAEAGEFALAGVRELTVEAVGDCKAKDGVADELKLLIVGGGCGGSFGVGLVGQGTMGEGELQELGTAEVVVEEGRERLAR